MPSSTRAAATSSWVDSGLEAHSVTSAPPARRARIRFAVSAVTCRQAAIRSPAKGFSFANRSRIDASTGMCRSAQAMRRIPWAARDRSATSCNGKLIESSGVAPLSAARIVPRVAGPRHSRTMRRCTSSTPTNATPTFASWRPQRCAAARTATAPGPCLPTPSASPRAAGSRAISDGSATSPSSTCSGWKAKSATSSPRRSPRARWRSGSTGSGASTTCSSTRASTC